MNDEFTKISESNFQFQTWGGKRPPEYRITTGLAPLIQRASVGDLAIITLLSPDEYRIDLHTIHSEMRVFFDEVIEQAIDNGLSFNTGYPSGLLEFAIEGRSARPNSPIFENRKLSEMEHSKRLLRDRKFRANLLEAYDRKCAISGEAMRVPGTELFELEGAHIVPVGSNGADSVVNGILLNPRLHWAFDRGLLHITEEYLVAVPESVLGCSENKYLHQFHSNPISLPHSISHYPSAEALRWHAHNVVLSS